jgi:phosphatidylglycerophosphate synthase
MRTSTGPSQPEARALAALSDSRAATDALLGAARESGWSPTAWRRFAELTVARSVWQAVDHPRALAELSALHAAVLKASRGGKQGWVATSWLLTITHLGLLEGRDGLTAADLLTLTRANLPALAPALAPEAGRWVGVVAIASDVADGHLARRRGTSSPFGAYADHLADAAFWTWMALRHEPNRMLRLLAVAAWAAPVAGVAAASIARGRMVEVPRRALLRPAAAMQAVIALRHLCRGRLMSRP